MGFPGSAKCSEQLSGQFYCRLEQMKICNFHKISFSKMDWDFEMIGFEIR
jgi:hypothetical protein